ncbi:hypothetical protein DYE50_04685 [Treponema ruminis]|uniref:Uncharacterized protein n=1 Tax=Treponema ruminis TaxID=744515 RepID=A0A7W8LLC0_9SPIR|nr:hypothetical protein [Treponema ruminis]MBB5225259.1 hypothetical protein [Treponema ruminis]QSI01870.1 hypothetical protein DYE50_04685 [Treponema ruminis]
MKRFFFEKLFAGVLASLSLFAFISCGEDAGLGSTVDTLPPELSISYPPDDAYVKGSFVFAGTCSDDKGVTRIEVSVKKLEKDGSTKDYGTSLADIKDSLTWSMEVNKSTDSGFELPDGIYKLEVTAWDRSGRKSGTIPRQFQIDNTPPVFVITKPGVNRKTFLSENSISKYGSLFAIEGTIADDHSIASMDITIYDKDGNLVAEPYSEKDISTTGGTSVTIARYIEGGIDELNTRYNDIYNVGDADASGNKIYSCTITIADSTKEYKNPGDGGVEGGNSTSVVYLYDDIYEDYMSAKKGAGLSANDFRSVLNGTATDASLAGKGIATDVTVEKVRAALNKFAKDTTNMEDDSLSFSLNPNADPTYNISGFNLNYNEAGTAIATGTNKAMGEQPLTIIVSAGLDQVNIDPKSLKVYIKKIIDADKAHITKDTLNKSIANLVTKVSELEIDLANANESSDSSAQKEAEAQLSVIDGWNLLLDNSQDPTPSDKTVTLSTELPASNYIEANAYYAIVVTGCDKDGIKLSQTKNYGFIGTVSAVPPSASFTSPKDLAYFANSKYIEGSETDKLVFTGTATENNAGMTLREITATLTVSDESSGKELPDSIQVTIKGDANNKWTKDGGLSCVYDEESHTNIWTFIPSLCGEAYQKIMAVSEGLMYLYNVNIKVTGTSALSYEMSRSVHIDTTKPVVQITSVSPLVYGKEYFGEDSEYKNYTFINSSILIQGSINEVNLENVTYDVRASEDLTADLSDEKYSVLGEIKEFYTKLGVENSIDGELGKIRTLDKKIRTDLVTNYFLATGKITKDQPIKARVVFRAIDNVGNVGEYNSIESNDGEDFYIYQETNRPKVTLGNAELSYKDGETQKSLSVDTEGLNKNNLTYEHNLFGTTNNNKLSVSFSDDDSVVEYEIFIAEDGKDFKKDENGREIPFYTATPNKTSASVNCTLPENEGVYKVKILARDFIRSDAMTDASEPYGVKEIGPFYIAVDSGAPSLSLSNPQNGAFVSRSNGVDGGVKGTVSKKGTKISGFIYQLGDKKKTPLVELTDAVIDEETPVNEVYNWTGKIATMPEEGTNFKLEITSIDAYGQSSTIIANLGIDEEAPTIKLNPDEDENFTGSKKILESNSNYNVKEIEGVKVNRYLVSGSWCDEKTVVNGETTELIQGTGTSELYYAYATEVENGEPKWCATQTVAGTAKSTAETTFNIYIPLTEGANFAYKVWGKDAAGNTTTPSEEAGTLVKGIMVDLGKPAIEKTAPASVPQYVKNGETLTITGKAEDSYGLNEIIAKVKLDGADIASGNKGYTFTKTIAEDKKSGTFTIQIESGDTNNGAWTFEIHATDLAGRESGTLNYNTVVDTKKPVWDADSFQVNKAPYASGTNHTWYKASSLPFAGMYKEEGSGIDHVDYTVIKAGETNGTTETFGTTKVTDEDGNFTGEESFSANLGEFERKVNESGTVANIVKFTAVDKAGNKSEETTVEIYIDTEAPALESDITGSQFSNTETPIDVTGTSTDDSSGIASVELELYEDGNTNRKGEAIPATSTATAEQGAYAKWQASIPAARLTGLESKPHSVKAIVIDGAGNKTTLTIFKINVDKDYPVITNISLTNTSEKYSVYQTKEKEADSTTEIDTYYVHNNDANKFSIYGSIMDQTSGIKTIGLYEGSSTTPLKEVTSLPITDIDFTGRTGLANLKIKATDNAQNVTEFPLVVKFDNTPPKGIHAIDKSNKDIFFRISDLNNWKVAEIEPGVFEGEIPANLWDTALDEDIGGKYSPTSYGKNQTVRVRGHISDRESGVDMIYYKVISAGTEEILQEDTTVTGETTVKGLNRIATEFLENYKDDNNGYFRANKIEEKRIAYTSIGDKDMVYDTDGNLVALLGNDESKKNGSGTIFENYVKDFGTCYGQDGVTDSLKRYATVTTNYDNSFTGFKDGHNYLILVAVDNVGNASIDSVNVVYGGSITEYSNFTLNVDTETPELQSAKSGQLLTNGSDDLNLNGTFSDNFSGVKTIVLDLVNNNTKKTVKSFSLNSNSPSPNAGFLTTSGTWDVTISSSDLTELGTAVYSVKATVTDRAGNQWPQSIFTIQKDATPPEIPSVKITHNSSTYKIYKPNENEDKYFVNPSEGTFKIEGVATDNYGIAKVELEIPGYSGDIEPVENTGTFSFDGLDLSEFTGTGVTVSLKVTDTAGNPFVVKDSDGNILKNSKEIEIIFDKNFPAWSDADFKINDKPYAYTDSSTHTWYKDSLLPFSGVLTENGCGIEKIDYKIIQAGKAASDASTGSFSTTVLTGTDAGKEKFLVNLSEFISREGTVNNEYNEVILTAYDRVGNQKAYTPVYIYIDTTPPVVTKQTTETLYSNGEGTLPKLTGTAQDIHAGLSSIVISVNGKEIKEGDTTYGSLTVTKTGEETITNDGGESTITYDEKLWKWEVEVNNAAVFNGVSAGNFSVSAIVTDATGSESKAGNKTTESIATVIMDGISPKVTLTAPTDASTDDDGTQINGTISLTGTISDENVLPEIAVTGIQYVKAPLNTNGKAKEFENLTDAEKNALSWTSLTKDSKGSMENLAFTGNYTFTISGFDTSKLDDESTYYLKAVAKDRAGNPGYSSVQTVIVSQDSDRPILKITNITDLGEASEPRFALKYGTKSQLNATVSDDDGIAEVVISETPYTGASGETAKGVTDANQLPTVKFTPEEDNNKGKNVDGEKKIYVYIKDTAGNKFYTTYTNTTDSTKTYLGLPKIRVGEDTLFYTAPNNAGNTACAKEFSYNSDSNSPTVGDILALAYEADGITANGGLKVDDNGNPIKLNGTDVYDQLETVSASYTVGGTKKQKVKFEITANDASGIAGITLEVSYKKDGTSVTDKYRPTAPASGTDALATILGNTELVNYTQSGTSVVEDFTVNGVTVPGLRWTTELISLAGIDTGSITLKVIPYDKLSLVGNGNITFTVDNSGPEIKIPSPDPMEEVTGTVTVSSTSTDVGGSKTHSTMWLIPTIEQQGTSESTLCTTAAWLDTGYTSKSTASSWAFELASDIIGKYDSNSYAKSINDGVYTLPFYIRSEDELGNYTIKTDYTIKHNPDADRPRTSISYPDKTGTSSAGTVLGGTIRVTGSSIIDASAEASVKAVYLQIATADSDGIFKFDSSDKTTVSNAVNKEGEINVGGYGYTVYDKDSAKTDLGFDADHNLLFVDSTAASDWWGVKANKTTSWNISLNENSEMDPASGKTRRIAIRACAINSNGKVGAWSEVYYIDVDATAPTQTATLRQFASGSDISTDLTNASAIRKYESEMYLKGDWYLTVELNDESSIHGYTVKKGGVLLEEGEYTESVKTYRYKDDSIDTTGTAASESNPIVNVSKTLFIPVDISASNVKYTVSVTDTETNGHTINATYNLNIDNKAPEIKKVFNGSDSEKSPEITANYNIADSDYTFILGGKVDEDGSGFESAVFYFVREGASYGRQTVLDPLWVKSSSDTGTAGSKAYLYETKTVSGKDLDDSTKPILTKRTFTQDDTHSYCLWALAVSGTMKADGYTFEASSSLASNKHIRAGGLIEVGGILRKIDSVNGTTVKFETSTGVTSDTSTIAYFPYAQVVDNTGKEKNASVSLNPFTVNSDDGDGMPEEVSGSKTNGFTWNATIHSTNMPDGPAKLVVLAFDKAGNVSGTSYEVNVVNSAPRLAKVFLGTDLNSNNIWAKDEFVAYNLYNANASHGIDNTEVKATVSIETSKYESKAAFQVKDKLAVIPEIVGGNGDIILIYKNGATTTDAVPSSGTGAGIRASSNAKVSSEEGADFITKLITSTNRIGTVIYNNKETDTSLLGFTLTSKQVAGLEDTGNLSATNGNKTGVNASFTFWDSTEEKEAGIDSQNCVLHISDLTLALVDNVRPEAKIRPFYWNSESNNSLYQNKHENGHIELEKDLSDSIFNGTGEFDKDPKVSGKVVLTGTLYDNKMLKSVQVKMSGFKFGSTAGAYKTLATYTAGTGWSAKETKKNGSLGTDGYEFYIDSDSLDQGGHTANWVLTLDTENTEAFASVAAADCELIVQAVDASGSSETQNSSVGTSNTEYAYEADGITLKMDGDKPSDELYTSYYRMDVVPYITGIETEIRTASGLKNSNIRSASGKYSILANNSSNTITVKGFNFKNGSIKAMIANKKSTEGTVAYDTSLTSGASATSTSAATVKLLGSGTVTGTTSFTITNTNIDKSGYLEVFSNNVRALNNINNNDAHGEFALTGNENSSGNKTPAINDYKSMPNRVNEADFYTTKNVTLTDDRYLRFFDMKDTEKKNAYYPNMIMEGNDPVFGFVDLNGTEESSIDTYGGSQIASGYQPQRAKYSGTTGNQSSIEYLIGGMSWDQMAMAKDSVGKYIHATSFNYADATMTIVYDKFASKYTWHPNGNELYTYTGAWGNGTGWSNMSYKENNKTYYYIERAEKTGNNAVSLEAISYGGKNLIGRYQNIKMVAKANSTTTADTSVYMAYYDDNTETKDVIFRTFQIKSTNTNTDWYSLGETGIKTNLKEKNTNGRIVARPSGTTYASWKGSKYLDIGVTPGTSSVVIIVYYDMEEGRLRMIYSGNAINGSSITPTPNWRTANVTFPSYVGTDVSMVIDGLGGIHITASDATDSDLVYMYMPSYSSNTLKTIKVDQAFSVGTWTSIKVKGNNTDGYVPYIAYYNATETGSRDSIKLAYLADSENTVAAADEKDIQGVDSNGYTTGKWEYMTVPAITPPQGGDSKFRAVCLDFDSSGKPVVGYLGTNLEFGKWLDE